MKPRVTEGFSRLGISLRVIGLKPWYIAGLVQDCDNSSALAMELLQSGTKPSIYEGCYTIQKYISHVLLKYIDDIAT